MEGDGEGGREPEKPWARAAGDHAPICGKPDARRRSPVARYGQGRGRGDRHLSVPPKSKLSITVEIVADVPDGVPEDVQRIVLESGTALKFKSQGFEAT